MTINQLTYLLTVVQEGINLSRASRRLGVSQPNISKQLSLLEQEVGAPLFERAGRRLNALTPAGRQLYRHAGKVTEELARLREDLSPAATEKTAIVGATAGTIRYVLPSMLAAAAPQLGDVSVEVEQLTGDDICQAVLQGRCDIGLVSGPVKPDPELVLLPWYRWRYRLIASRHGNSRPKGTSNRDLLRDHPIIACASITAPRSSVLRAIERLGITEKIDRITPNPDEVKDVVRANGHIGLLAEMAYSEEADADLDAYEVPPPFPTLMAWIAVRKSTPLRPGISALIGGFASHLRPEVIEGLRLGTTGCDPAGGGWSVKVPRYG